MVWKTPLARLAINETGCAVHLMGFVKVFRTIATNGDAEHWASSNSQETWAQIDKLLKEKLPLSGIARVTGISGTWLQPYVNRLYEKQHLEPQPVKKKESCV